MKRTVFKLNTILSGILTLFLFVSIVVIVANIATLRDTKTFAASSTRNPGSVSGSGWVNGANAITSNNSYTTVTNMSGGTYYSAVGASNFGFTIPSGSTNLSALVEIERHNSGAQFQTDYRDNQVYLYNGGSVIAGNLCDSGCFNTPVPSVDTYKSFSYSGANLTPAVVNSSNFRVVYGVMIINNTAYVDHIRVTINYTPPPPAPTFSFSADNTNLAYNSSTTLRWDSSNATNCTASGAWSGTKPADGSQGIGPLTSTKTYNLSCTGGGGTSQVQSVTVNVGAAPPPDDGGGDSGGDPGGGDPGDGDLGSGNPGSGDSGSGSSNPGPIAAAPSTPSGFGERPLPAPTTNQTVSGILNTLNLKLSLPYISGKTRLLTVIGGYSYELDVFSAQTEYTIDLRAANFPLGKEIDLALGGQFLLIKKAKIIPQTESAPVDLGELPIGDLNNDNRINSGDKEILLRSVGRSNGGDITNDGVTNSFDWAVFLKYNGKSGD